MEIKDLIILWTYSQWRQAIVVIPPFSPERSYVLPAFLRSQVGISWTDVCWRLNFIMAGRCHSTGIAGVWIPRIASFIKSEEQHIPWIHIQHSTFHHQPKADGFETTDCLECLQILDILIYGRRVCFKAGDWTLCTILGYGLPERETFCMLSFS